MVFSLSAEGVQRPPGPELLFLSYLLGVASSLILFSVSWKILLFLPSFLPPLSLLWAVIHPLGHFPALPSRISSDDVRVL